MSILENNGFINQFLGKIGLLDALGVRYIPLINTGGAIVLGMVYNFLPFMVLPIYNVLVRLDHKLVEAAEDLGAPTSVVFRKVLIPLSIPGVLSGITMVFVPAVSTFVISAVLGGGKNMLIGDLIDLQFMTGAYNPQVGSAVALVMMLLVFLCMVVMNRFDDGSNEGGGMLF
jgi:spermidine/putrescine transport system permease protein